MKSSQQPQTLIKKPRKRNSSQLFSFNVPRGGEVPDINISALVQTIPAANTQLSKAKPGPLSVNTREAYEDVEYFFDKVKKRFLSSSKTKVQTDHPSNSSSLIKGI